jgi:hypothetical protein
VTDLETKVVQLQTQYEIKQGGVVDEEHGFSLIETDAERLKADLGEKEIQVQQLTSVTLKPSMITTSLSKNTRMPTICTKRS